MTQNAASKEITKQPAQASESLFERVCAWLHDDANTGSLAGEQAKAVAPMLADLEAKRLLLLFKPDDPYQADQSRTSFALNDTGQSHRLRKKNGAEIEVSPEMVIDLCVENGNQAADGAWNISDAALADLARDALTVYAHNLDAVRHCPAVEAVVPRL
ncbi:MAG: hypothetical protein KGI97_05770 [Alphaproteobacteria bacterium]|nr:hypothetical protein [Alphaproteobacteria bacterium]